MTTYRPDLTDYEPYIGILADKLNENAVNKMSKTDAVKIAIERALETICPDCVINRKRKKYVTLEF
jgi:hypothetical protein